MKHFNITFFLFFMLSASYGQDIFDNAVQGSGTGQHTYVGQWVHNNSQPGFYLNSLSYSSAANAFVTLGFVGNKVEWYTEKKWTHGIAAISIDGGTETLVDLYSPTEQHLVVYSSPELTQGGHLVKIRFTGTKNPASTGYYVIHDYFGVYQLTSASTNTAYGVLANSNHSGQYTSAFGYQAVSNGAGDYNTGFGYNVLTGGTGSSNSAFGANALSSNIESSGNTAVGYNSLNSAAKAAGNTAIGSGAMPAAASATANTAVGVAAMGQGVSGLGQNGNTAVGSNAMNVANPGAGNTALGSNAGPTGTEFIYGSTAVGTNAKNTAPFQVRVGSTDVANIGGIVSWSTLSDARFKKDIREDAPGLEFVNHLRPVSYVVDRALLKQFVGVKDDESETRGARLIPSRETGFIAQEVEKIVQKSGYVFHGVEAPNNSHDMYSIRYSDFVVPLVKAVQELTTIVEAQKAALEQQQLKIEALLEKYNAAEGVKQSTGASMLQNTPNPFTDATQIRMTVSEGASTAVLMIYNLEGKQIKQIPVTGRGDTSISIGSSELAAGMYLYSLIVDGDLVDTKRMVLSR